MKKQRLGEKDYSRLSRTSNGGSEGKEESMGKTSSRSRKRKRTSLDQRGLVQPGRERVWRRWSKASRQGRKRELNLNRHVVNGGKLRRDRGVTRDMGKERSSLRKETGRYSRRAVEGGKSREGVKQFFERTEGDSTVKRRGVGRKEKGSTRRWVGHFVEWKTEEENREKERTSRREAWRAIPVELTNETITERLKKVYRTVRRKGWRRQGVARANVRVGHETKQKQS
jgi:hypothetical protein